LCVEAQKETTVNLDSCRTAFCECLTALKDFPDTIAVKNCFLRTFADTIEKIHSEKEFNQLTYEMLIRCQQECKTFYDLTRRYANDTTMFTSLNSFPDAMNNRHGCREIMKDRGLYYLENDSSKTQINIKRNAWIDSMENGKYYSKLKMEWTDDCEFVITFIESNHPVKKYLSKPGDRYTYRIVDKTNKYYTLAVTYNSIISEFRVYIP
jgi:hypothetical protein